MRIGFVVTRVDGMGGTSRSVITQAGALAARGHEVRILSLTRSADAPHHRIDPAVEVTRLVDVRDRTALPPADRRLHARESRLVPRRWDPNFTALHEQALRRALPGLRLDVLVTTSPALLAAAVQLSPDRLVVVHQEHRSSSDRTHGLEPLLTFAPQADVVALLSPAAQAWLRGELGDLAPPTVVMPNALAPGYRPRSTRTEPLVVGAGRLVAEKQWGRLVEAFTLVADRMPAWRLRICGDGPALEDLLARQDAARLWDRIELPGAVPDLATHWAQASIAVLASRSEGYPLVLQEAMAAGVPAVSFDSPTGAREVVTDGVDGLLVAPQSTSGLARALLRLAEDGELRDRLGSAALRTAQGWSADGIASRWEEVFERARTDRGLHGRLEARARGPRPEPVAPDAVPDPPGVSPVVARRTALGVVVAIAREVSPHWLVVPPHERAAPVLVLPMGVRDAFLAELAERPGPGWLSLRDLTGRGWPERRGTVAGLAPGLRRGRGAVLALEPWPVVGRRPSLLAEDAGVEVEFWEAAPDGRLVAPRRSPYAARLPADLGTGEAVETELGQLPGQPGVVVRSLPLLLAPTVTECRFEVDAVLTWVDGADPAWAASRRERLAAVGGATGAAGAREASGEARFRDRGELRWALRSLHLFAPWVRRIHLVTAGQTPDWLDTEHPMIHLVDHREILPADALPTFNSHAIETALHRIEGLAEHFVYLNDDFMLGRPLRKETFFSPGGETAVWPAPLPVGLEEQPDAAPFVAAAHRNRRLLLDELGTVLTATLAHVPYAHRVSVLEEVGARFADPVGRTAHSPFRSADDISMLSSLAQHYGLVTGTAFVGDADAHPLAFVNISNADVDTQLRRLQHRRQSFICLGDHHDQALREDVLARLLQTHLGRYFPVAAPWEHS